MNNRGVRRVPFAGTSCRTLGAERIILLRFCPFFMLAFFSGCFSFDPSALDSRWQPLNAGLAPHIPVSAVAFAPLGGLHHPHDPRYIAVGVYDPLSLYTSEDGGMTWRVDETLGQPLHALRFDAEHPGRLLAGSADGLYVGAFANGQWSWARNPDWPTARAVFAIEQEADGTRYAGGEAMLDRPPAVWRSKDGEMWRPLAPLPVPNGSAVLSVAAADTLLLAGTDGYGLFISRDTGKTWTQAGEMGTTFVAALWIAPWDPALILARTREGLFRSANGAESWQRTGADLAGRVDAIAATPDGAIFLGMSTGRILRSTDGGVTWQPWSALDRDGLFNTLSIDPANPDRFYAGTQHGLYHSADGGRTWRPIPHIGHYRATALAQAPDGTLYLGNEDGVYASTQDGERWRPLGRGLPPRAVQDLAVWPGEPPTLFAGTDAGIYRSTDAGASWHALGWTEQGVPEVALDPADPNRLYVRLAYERVYSTDDALADVESGATAHWTARWEGMPTTTEILSIAVDPHNPDRLYAGGAMDFYASEDRSLSWRPIAPELAGQSIFAVAVAPQQPGHVYAGATNGLYHSVDDGATWTRLGLENVTVSALAFHPTQPDVLYAGTFYQGIYRSGDGGETWDSLGPAGVKVHDLLIPSDGQKIYAATDEGFWRGILAGNKAG